MLFEFEHCDISANEIKQGFLDIDITDYASVIRIRLKKEDIEELACKMFDWVDSTKNKENIC